MFDLAKLNFIKTAKDRKNYSFVGLKKSENNPEKLDFYLPLGFEDFEENFEKSKSLFFGMYRTFKRYRERNLEKILEQTRNKSRDGVQEGENKTSLDSQNDETALFYGKLNALEKILEAYDDLQISCLERKQVRSNEIDYSKIYKYLHQAIYLDNDVIYLDEMNITKNVLSTENPPIVQMFCFIYVEIKIELEETSSISRLAFELAEKFKDAYLFSDSALFEEDYFAETLQTLKQIFADIEHKTTYKDDDFWHFYKAIEAFLFDQYQNEAEGIYWGIENFHEIWEDMCQNYILDPKKEEFSQILFAEKNGVLQNRTDLGLDKKLDKNPFEIVFGEQKKFCRPDLVYLEKIDWENIDKDSILEKIYEAKVKPHNESFKNKIVTLFEKTKKYLPKIQEILTKYEEKAFYAYHQSSKFKNTILEKHYDRFEQEVFESLKTDDFILIKLYIVSSKIMIIDYKYSAESEYENYDSESKTSADIQKQLVYEWAVQQNIPNSETESRFWIPYYNSKASNDIGKLAKIKNPVFEASQIKVFKINFNFLQKKYLANESD